MTPRPLPGPELLAHITDVHCHPTDSYEDSMHAMEQINIHICAMSTSPTDQILVSQLADAYPNRVTPAFGYHPWFIHQFYLGEAPASKADHYEALFTNQSIDLTTLPDPIPFADALSVLRANLLAYPTAMVGEIGLDKAFRVNSKSQHPLTLPFEHQLAICEAQLEIAIELHRNTSLHVVRAPQAAVDMLQRLKTKHSAAFDRVSIDLHSCSLSVDSWLTVQKRHKNVYFSLSTAINGRSQAYEKLIAAADPSRLLVESDINDAGECTDRTWNILCKIADIKGWIVEDRHWEDREPEAEWGVIRRIEANWKAFCGSR